MVKTGLVAATDEGPIVSRIETALAGVNTW
jgi:hypothetical protein